MTKLLYILTRYPLPVTTGRHRMINQNIMMLRGHYDIDILYFDKKDKSRKDYVGINSARLELPSLFEVLFNLIFRVGYSFQERIYFSRKSNRLINSRIKKNNYGLVMCDMVRTAQYVENLSMHKVLDIDDLLSLRYERMLSKDSKIDLLGSLEHKYLKRTLFLFTPFFKYILQLEASLIRKRELELMKSFDSTFFVSQLEARRQEKFNVYCVPPMVEEKENEYLKREHNENRLLFFGNLITNQNRESIRNIVNFLYPLLKLKLDSFVLVFVGKHDSRIKEIVSNVDNQHLELHGYVEDLDELIARSKLAIMPIAYGTGIKTKILDALSTGLPVLTNSVGIEGLNVKKGKELEYSDNWEDLASIILDLINNQEQLLSLSNHGYLYIHKNFNAIKVQKDLFRAIGSSCLQ